jgi:hypothetical protein
VRRLVLVATTLVAAALLSSFPGSLARATSSAPTTKLVSRSPAGTHQRAPIVDDFNDNRVDSRLWNTFTVGTGVTVEETNQRLEVSFAPNAQPGGASDSTDGQYASRCLMTGDFDMEVDYQLLEWPANNGIFMQLGAPPLGGMARSSSNGIEQYHGYSSGRGEGTRTTDRSGSFRLVRAGDRLRAYYRRGPDWALVFEGTAPSGNATATLHAQARRELFAHQAVRVAFDNFRLSSGELTCPNTGTRPRGVIARAWMSRLGRSVPVSRVRRAAALQANFRFRVLPAPGSRVRVDWFRGSRFILNIGKEPSSLVTSVLKGSGGLPPGVYRARLMVQPPGLPFSRLATAAVRVG